MNRRKFLGTVGAATVTAFAPVSAFADRSPAGYANLLVLVELKGGNDGLNSVVPYADAAYYELRPRLAIPREQVLQLDQGTGLNPALEPLMPLWKKGELAIVQSVGYPDANLSHSPFGNAIRTAAQVAASRAGVAAVKVSLGGFDTHSNQPGQHARLLKELAEGLVTLRAALLEIGRWDSALVMTYAEFGRRPRENLSRGTDHGTANAHFVLGGRVRGGLYGREPGLSRLDGNGNMPFAVDFRDLYATVLERWWGVDSARALNDRFAPVGLLRA